MDKGREKRNKSISTKKWKGLITNVVNSNLPIDALSEADNVVFDVDGGARKREGFLQKIDKDHSEILYYDKKNIKVNEDKTGKIDVKNHFSSTTVDAKDITEQEEFIPAIYKDLIMLSGESSPVKIDDIFKTQYVYHKDILQINNSWSDNIIDKKLKDGGNLLFEFIPYDNTPKNIEAIYSDSAIGIGNFLYHYIFDSFSKQFLKTIYLPNVETMFSVRHEHFYDKGSPQINIYPFMKLKYIYKYGIIPIPTANLYIANATNIEDKGLINLNINDTFFVLNLNDKYKDENLFVKAGGGYYEDVLIRVFSDSVVFHQANDHSWDLFSISTFSNGIFYREKIYESQINTTESNFVATIYRGSENIQTAIYNKKTIIDSNISYTLSGLHNLYSEKITDINVSGIFTGLLRFIYLPNTNNIATDSFKTIWNHESTVVTIKNKFNNDNDKDRIFGIKNWNRIDFRWV